MTGSGPPRLLIVTAVAAERDAAAAELEAAGSLLGPYSSLTATTAFGRVDLVAAGVGCAAAAAATATALSAATYRLVLSVGVGGGFAPIEPGTVVVSSAIVHADLGAESPDGFLPADGLGLGPTRFDVAAELADGLAERAGGQTGAVLTVSTVTGTSATATALLTRYPDAAAEAMEGAGVHAAAAAFGVPMAEIRAISNVVGPRDRSAWQLDRALTALTRAVAGVGGQVWR